MIYWYIWGLELKTSNCSTKNLLLFRFFKHLLLMLMFTSYKYFQNIIYFYRLPILTFSLVNLPFNLKSVRLGKNWRLSLIWPREEIILWAHLNHRHRVSSSFLISNRHNGFHMEFYYLLMLFKHNLCNTKTNIFNSVKSGKKVF